jgi:hypothetical protein
MFTISQMIAITARSVLREYSEPILYLDHSTLANTSKRPIAAANLMYHSPRGMFLDRRRRDGTMRASPSMALLPRGRQRHGARSGRATRDHANAFGLHQNEPFERRPLSHGFASLGIRHIRRPFLPKGTASPHSRLAGPGCAGYFEGSSVDARRAALYRAPATVSNAIAQRLLNSNWSR